MALASERKRRGRLSRSGDFDRVYRQGSSHESRFLKVYAFANAGDAGDEDASQRLGLSVGRKVGDSVERNSVKRALREAFWALAPRLPQDFDFVLVARPDLAKLVADDGEKGAEKALGDLLAEGNLMEGV